MNFHAFQPTMMMIIGGAIYVILLIVFFVMANNVARIRKKLYDTLTAEDYINIARREMYVGNKKLAAENYLRAKYYYLHDSSRHKIPQDELTRMIVEIDEEVTKLKSR